MNCVCCHPPKFEAIPRKLDLSHDHACDSYFFMDAIVEWTCIFLEKRGLAEFTDFGLKSFIFVLRD